MYQLRACAKCDGDLAREGDEWRCLQCGARRYPPRPALEDWQGTLDRRSYGGRHDTSLVGRTKQHDQRDYIRGYRRRWRAKQRALGGRFVNGKLVWPSSAVPRGAEAV